MTAIDEARQVLESAIESGIFPAAAVEVGSSAGPLWQDALGTLTLAPDAASALLGTPFDLASLTKVLATTTIIMELSAGSAIRLDERLADVFRDWRGADRDRVTIQDLLEHASGLPARLLDSPPASRREFEHDISVMPLEYQPRSRSLYSDLDFILLGFLASDRGGRSLADQFDAILDRLAAVDRTLATGPLTFTPAGAVRSQTAPTLPLEGDPRRGRALIGEVHDEYAAVLGASAGHAGVFGSAPAVGAFARIVLRAARGDHGLPAPMSPPLVATFVSKSTVPGSSRALGWDTMLTTSSCGTRMTRTAFGHVGFTGTSLWIDPGRDRYFVLLTNRACGGGTVEAMRDVRRAFHDALAEV